MPRSIKPKQLVTPRKSPVQDRSRRTVQAILEATAQVLERDGYAATTTDRIAERAGVSIGSLYQYFPNKDAILLTLALCHGLDGASTLTPFVRELQENPPPIDEALRRFVRISAHLHRRPRLHQILFSETPIPPETRRALARGGNAIAHELMGYFERAPGARPRDPHLAAHLVLETIGQLIHHFVIEPPHGYTPEQCEEELVALLLGYLRAPESAARGAASRRS